MQARYNEHVEHAGLLKVRGFVAIDKTSVAEQHRAQYTGDFGPRAEQRINLVAHSPSRTRYKDPRCQRRDRDALDQLRRPKRGGEIDILGGQIGAPVEGAVISEDLRALGLRQNGDAIACMKIGQRVITGMRR